MHTKFARVAAMVAVTFVALLSLSPLATPSIAQARPASRSSDPSVVVVVDLTLAAQCRTQRTTKPVPITLATSTPCLPGTVMHVEAVPLS